MVTIKVLAVCCLLGLAPAIHMDAVEDRHDGGDSAAAEAERPRLRRHGGRKDAKDQAAESAEANLAKEELSDKDQRADMDQRVFSRKEHWEKLHEFEEARAKRLAQVAIKRAESNKRLAQVKEGRREVVRESIARAEKRLNEKIHEADMVNQKEEQKLKAQMQDEDRKNNVMKEKKAAAERAVARLKQREDQAKEMAARVKARAQAAIEEQKRYEEATVQREVNKVKDDLRQEVIQQRKAAQTPDFFAKRNQEDPLAELKQKLNLGDVIKGFNAVVRSNGFMLDLPIAFDKILDAAGSYEYHAEKKLAAFSEKATANATDEEFVPLLAKFMQESVQLLAKHLRAAGIIKQGVQNKMHGGLQKALEPVVEFVTPEAIPASLNATGLEAVPLKEACDGFALAVADMSPIQDSINKVHKALNATSKFVPTLPRVDASTKHESVTTMQSLLSLGYAEIVVLSKVAQDINTTVGSIVKERCAKFERKKARHY